MTHLVPNTYGPRTFGPHLIGPSGQTVPNQFCPYGQMVPQNLVPLDKWSLKYYICPGAPAVMILKYGDQIGWGPFVHGDQIGWGPFVHGDQI